MWFDSWDDLVRILLVGTAAYGGLVVVLRVTGKRTLAQLNAFDFIVTVAFGSALSTVLLNSSVSWSEGLLAMGLFAALQFTMAWLSSRSERIRRVIRAKPVVLLRNGTIGADALRRSRLSESEVHQAIRSCGIGDVSKVAAVVLETNGKLSVIAEGDLGDGSALPDVRVY